MSASVCGKCSAAAEFLAESWSEIFLEAVAEAEVHLEGAADGDSIQAVSNAFVEAVADATVTAYAQVSHPRQDAAAHCCRVVGPLAIHCYPRILIV